MRREKIINAAEQIRLICKSGRENKHEAELDISNIDDLAKTIIKEAADEV